MKMRFLMQHFHLRFFVQHFRMRFLMQRLHLRTSLHRLNHYTGGTPHACCDNRRQRGDWPLCL